MKIFLRLTRLGLIAAFSLLVIGVIGAGATYLYIAPELPPIEQLRDVRFQVPLRVYSRDDVLVAEFGEKRRIPLTADQIPPPMVQAFLAAEDDRFYEHPGVDYQGIVRAALQLVLTGEKRQGGSTITMQVARNFFLSSEKTFIRKFKEIFLALKIERELTKAQILELYLNKIYLGNRAYGVGAAAQVYYGTTPDQLTLAQTAMIAGLPKAPSRYNPLANRQRATERRDYVLGRMRALGFIDDTGYREAVAQPDDAAPHGLAIGVDAAYAAEMVRSEMVDRFGTDAYTAGYRVRTTLLAREQEAAVNAAREALIAYDRRQGYRGPEQRLAWQDESDEDAWDEALANLPAIGGLRSGIVVGLGKESANVYLGQREYAELPATGMAWALHAPAAAPDTAERIAALLAPGDVIRLRSTPEGWELAQIPEVEGALVALSPLDGGITALVGGFDFQRNKFNRAVQAQRQPGSSLKPFIYSAALDRGFSAASIFNDAPVVVDDPALETTWRPENYSGRFYGPTRLREALVRSRNLVSIRVLQAVGVSRAIRHLARFGLPKERLPRDLSLALGSATVSPLELAGAYAVFASGGYRVEPYLIEQIEDADGQVLYRADPFVVCPDCEKQEAAETEAAGADVPPATPPSTPTPQSTDEGVAALTPDSVPAPPPMPRSAPRAIEAGNAYLMYTMMQDVIRRGTGRRALQLGRTDLAGKTGTTNDQRDAWFSGFNGQRVAVTWVGYDDVRSLGDKETGSRAALPMWTGFMQQALRDIPEAPLAQPEGLVSARIDPVTGLLAGAALAGARFELFREGNLPEPSPEVAATPASQPAGPGQNTPPKPDSSEQLF